MKRRRTMRRSGTHALIVRSVETYKAERLIDILKTFPDSFWDYYIVHSN